MKTKGSVLPPADRLAIERTLLANERTFLAYFRTSIVFLTSGVAILNIEFFESVRHLSILLIGLSPALLLVGIWRVIVVRRRVLSMYD